MTALLVQAIKYLPYSLSKKRTVRGWKKEVFPWRIHEAPEEEQVQAPSGFRTDPSKDPLLKMSSWRWNQTRSPLSLFLPVRALRGLLHVGNTRKDPIEPQKYTDVRDVPRPSSIPLGSEFTRKDTIMRGHIFVPSVAKASSRHQTSMCIRGSTQERSPSRAARVKWPSPTKPTFALMREPTQERSPMSVPSARDASASLPPTTAI